ncbi:MAG TPA: peptidylprolyl isomerase, partial [Methylomirabilota bacterium]|nr:peptidylprolyl isomerase [Methylomirabilota bacterium]
QMRARIKQLIVAQFKEREFKPASPAVSEHEIEAAYQNDGGRFAQPAAVRGAAIFLSMPATATAEKKAECRARAEAVLAEARGAADEAAFAKLVAQHSEDQASRYRGGDLGWLTPGAAGVEPALAGALFALKAPGDFAPLVQTPRGFYIAKLLERREAGRKPLSEVRETIRHQLSRAKAAQAERDFYAAMKAGLDITVNRELVEAISLPGDKHEPPRMPGAATAQVRSEP